MGNKGAVPVLREDKAAVILEELSQRLATIASVSEAKMVADQATTLAQYAKRAKLGREAQNRCTAVRLWAERRGGEELKKMPRGPIGGAQSGRGEKHSLTFGECLGELGINTDNAYRWQRLAELPEDWFRALLTELVARNDWGELTAAGMDRAARRWIANSERVTTDSPPDVVEAWVNGELSKTLGQLGQRVGRFLEPGRDEVEKLEMILSDRSHFGWLEMERLCEIFVNLGHRVSACVVAIDARRRALGAALDESATVSSEGELLAKTLLRRAGAEANVELVTTS